MSQIVRAAVQNDGSALQYASEALKTDDTLVLDAIRSDPSSILCDIYLRVCFSCNVI
jgi:hypothetical protein